MIFMLQHYVLYPHRTPNIVTAELEEENEGEKRDEGAEVADELLTV